MNPNSGHEAHQPGWEEGPPIHTDSYAGQYSVMQSDWNSICGDVILHSLNNASPDEDNILDKIYYSKYVRAFITMILIGLIFISNSPFIMEWFIHTGVITYKWICR